MKHIHTIKPASFAKILQRAGCGECQTSCQSACKTSCTVGNQICENSRINKPVVNTRA
ncbi:MAG: six-cysteine ranthipeptide SCIFF [Clostridiales bacterium]|jgi:predicted ribosomally synthesized six-cysteine peptide SCIFF|nr:six-cysteine ranthipeptide SCIFF [Clostridiales bacterium]